MSHYQSLWTEAVARNERGILLLIIYGVAMAAGWLLLPKVPARWRGIAEIGYLVSIGAVYAAILILTEASNV